MACCLQVSLVYPTWPIDTENERLASVIQSGSNIVTSNESSVFGTNEHDSVAIATLQVRAGSCDGSNSLFVFVM